MLLDINFVDDATRPPVPVLENLTEAQRAPGHHLRMIHDHLRDNMVTLGKLIERANVTVSIPRIVANVGALFEDIAPGAGRGGARLLVNYGGFTSPAGASLRFVNADGVVVSGPGLDGDLEFDAQSDNNLIRGCSLVGGSVNDAGSGNCFLRNDGLPDSCP